MRFEFFLAGMNAQSDEVGRILLGDNTGGGAVISGSGYGMLEHAFQLDSLLYIQSCTYTQTHTHTHN